MLNPTPVDVDARMTRGEKRWLRQVTEAPERRLAADPALSDWQLSAVRHSAAAARIAWDIPAPRRRRLSVSDFLALRPDCRCGRVRTALVRRRCAYVRDWETDRGQRRRNGLADRSRVRRSGGAERAARAAPGVRKGRRRELRHCRRERAAPAG
jgi:hypothetical protein